MSWGGTRAKVLEAAREYASNSYGVTRCGYCRKWYYRGPFRDGRQALRAHQERCAKAVAA